MIRNFVKLLRKSQIKRHDVQNPAIESDQQQMLFPDLQQNEQLFRSIYSHCSDVVFRSLVIGGKRKALIIYIEGLTDVSGLDEYVIPSLMRVETNVPLGIRQLIEQKLTISNFTEVCSFAESIEHLSTGYPVLLYDNEARGFALGLNKWEKRSIEEPSAEVGVRGPREGFTETLRVSTSQIRRIIKSPKLKMESMKIGDYTQTNIAVAYIEGLADAGLITQIKNRLNRIQIDGILESGYIEEMIEDNPYSPFPQLLSTERPDVVCANLLEGRAAILVDGTPFVLIAPITFFSLMQSAEDYYQRFLISTVIRWLRYAFGLISLFLPALYVAITTFHQEMVPSSLLLSMAASREPVPFPALVEVLIMEITFEALREAGIRLPKQVGAAVSIVGALVIGQAAVQAGLVSAPMLIVVAITGIASSLIPRYAAGIALRMMRFPLIFLAGTLGLLGIMMGIIAIVLHLCSLRSFGVPYLSTVATPKINELKDVLIRAPLWMMDTRPHLTGDFNEYRQSAGLKPGPERDGES